MQVAMAEQVTKVAEILICVSVKDERFHYEQIKVGQRWFNEPIEGPRISEVDRIEKEIRRSLKRLGKTVVKHPNKLRKIQRFIEDLQRHGQDLHEMLFGNLTIVSSFLENRLRFAVHKIESGSSPIRIEVELRSKCNFPLEYVFLQPADSDYPYEILKRFVGSAFLINYVIPPQRGCNLTLNNDPKLPLKLFICDNNSQNRRDIINFFKDNIAPDSDDSEVHWPNEKTQDYLLDDDFIELICNINRTPIMGDRTVPDQIHHFCCILTRISKSEDNCRLRFSCKKEVKVNDELMLKCGWVMNSPEKDRPVVFLNTCAHSKIWPISLTSIPRFFLQTMFSRSFICPEDIIPGLFSTKFSKQFYYYLLKKKPIGEALHRAKWDFINQYNPLGMLYKLYGHPDIEVLHFVNMAYKND